MPTSDATVAYKEIPDFPGYRVGDDGTVWSCWRRIRRGKGAGRGARWGMGEEWRQLAPGVDQDGYLIVVLSCNQKKRVRKVHQLVLELFVGPRPAGHEACHFPDRSRANCRLGNLRWGTRKQNSQDRLMHKTDARGEKNSKAVLTAAKVRAIRRRHAKGESGVSLARAFKVTPYTISDIVRRKTWKHI